MLKLYLCQLQIDKVASVEVYRDLETLLDSCSTLLNDNEDSSALIHVGFTYPTITNISEISSLASVDSTSFSSRARIYLTASAKWSLPADYESSDKIVAHIDLNGSSLPCYLALTGFGYDTPDIESDGPSQAVHEEFDPTSGQLSQNVDFALLDRLDSVYKKLFWKMGFYTVDQLISYSEDDFFDEIASILNEPSAIDYAPLLQKAWGESTHISKRPHWRPTHIEDSILDTLMPHLKFALSHLGLKFGSNISNLGDSLRRVAQTRYEQALDFVELPISSCGLSDSTAVELEKHAVSKVRDLLEHNYLDRNVLNPKHTASRYQPLSSALSRNQIYEIENLLEEHFIDYALLDDSNTSELSRRVKESNPASVKSNVDISSNKIDPLLLHSIDSLGLSVRLENCLKAEGLYRIGDLIQKTSRDLLEFPNLGINSLTEIQDKLAERDLSFLGTKIDNWISFSRGDEFDPYLLLSINNLGLSTRSTNCLKAKKIYYIGDLVRRSEIELLKIPNINKTLVHKIKNKLRQRDLSLGVQLDNWVEPRGRNEDVVYREPNSPYPDVRESNSPYPDVKLEHPVDDDEALVTYSLHDASSLIEHIEITLGQMGIRNREVLEYRLGKGGEKLTLEEIGTKFSITKERVRQIEKRYVRNIIKSEFWDDVIGIRIGRVLNNLDTPLYLEFLPIEDEWFKGFEDDFDYLGRTIEVFSDGELNVVTINSRQVITRMPRKTLEIFLPSLKTTIETAINDEGDWTRSEIQSLVYTELANHQAHELTPLITEYLLERYDEDSEGLLVPTARNIDSATRRVLESMSEPQHANEIVGRVEAILGESVNTRTVENVAINIGFLFGRRIYGTAKHIKYSSETCELITIIAEEAISSGYEYRQWHTHELVNLVNEDARLKDEPLDSYQACAIFSTYSNYLTYLGRLIWCTKRSGMTERIELEEAAIRILEEAGEPLLEFRLWEEITKVRGTGNNRQLHPSNRLVVVSSQPKKWGLVNANHS